MTRRPLRAPAALVGFRVIAVVSAVTLALPAQAGRGSVRGAGLAAAASRPVSSGQVAARPSTAPAPQPGAARDIARTAPATGASRPVAAQPGAGTGIRTGAAEGARGSYGSAAVARAPGSTAAGRNVVAGRSYSGPVWATQLPAGWQSRNLRGRDYYTNGGYYYRPWLYRGVPYYYYVWPPYYTYYEEPPVGAVDLSGDDASLFYGDGSYYELTYEQGEPAYEVVPAPTGVALPAARMPADVPTVTVGGMTWVFYANTFYERVAGSGGDEFVVVAEPPGVVKLNPLPGDAEPVQGSSHSYFRSGGRYYLPYLDARGDESFLEVNPPGMAVRSSGASAPPPASAPAITTMIVRAGTTTTVRVSRGIDSARSRAGDAFEGTLAEDLRSDGKLVAAQGSRAQGTLVEAGVAIGSGAPALALRLTDLSIGGRMVAVSSEVERFGAASAAPAAASAATLGDSIGAAIDGGAGTAPPPTGSITLAPGTPIEFRLSSTLMVGVAAN